MQQLTRGPSLRRRLIPNTTSTGDCMDTNNMLNMGLFPRQVLRPLVRGRLPREDLTPEVVVMAKVLLVKAVEKVVPPKEGVKEKVRLLVRVGTPHRKERTRAMGKATVNGPDE